MSFSDKAIDEFIEIYQRNFGETISRGDADEMARRLTNMYRLFLRPLPEKKEQAPEAEAGQDSSPSQAS
jgi:hypothetical protein